TGRPLRAASDGAHRRLAGVRIRIGCQSLPATAHTGEIGAPRHRRQRRSSGAARRQAGHRTALASSGTRQAELARSQNAGAEVAPSHEASAHHAAEPGEWAVTGTFMFAEADLAALEGKARTAFRAGFLGTASLGWSTLVQVVEAGEDGRRAAIDTLARQLV